MNAITRNAPKLPNLKPPTPKVPKPVKIYWKYLKEVGEIIFIMLASIVAFGTPFAALIYIVVRLSTPNSLHHALYWTLALFFVSVFWYTGVYAYFKNREERSRGY